MGFHLGATSSLISVLKSNEKLLMLVHNAESDLENYFNLLSTKTKEGVSPTFRSSFKYGGAKNTIIYYFLDRSEVKINQLIV